MAGARSNNNHEVPSWRQNVPLGGRLASTILIAFEIVTQLRSWPPMMGSTSQVECPMLGMRPAFGIFDNPSRLQLL